MATKGRRFYQIHGGWRHCNIARLKDDFRGFESFPDGTVFKEITPESYMEGPFMPARRQVLPDVV